MKNFNKENKSVLITGASSGIGKAAAVYFAERGWNVAATMRSPEKDTVLGKLNNVLLLRLDVTEVPSITAAIDEAVAAFGKLDVVVNNAGYGALGPFEATNQSTVQRQFDTNVFGVMNVVREILPHFRARKSGTIVNVTSIGGRLTTPLYSIYHATKFAVEGFSESLRYELRPFNIKVKTVLPGPIKTDFYDRSADFISKPGLTAYDDYTSVALPNIAEAGRTAQGPEVTAKAIYHAATDSSNKMRYAGGGGAGLLMFLNAVMPLWVMQAVPRMVIERKKK